MSESSPRFSLLRDRILPGLALLAMAGALWMTRPTRWNATPAEVGRTQSCLVNLAHIAHAFAHYAQDYDGKFPRGVDPEDRHHPEIWARYNAFEGQYFNDARTAPMLHELLQPYVPHHKVWRCPEDIGWEVSRLPTLRESPLRRVKPSSWAKYGTSYYYFTIHGFAEMTASDLNDPSRSLILFDGDLWHRAGGQPSLNGLFADGHTQNLTAPRFQSLLRGRSGDSEP
ncbi:MAG: hypothetical protein M3347_15100 [Armatimonadota bacterium]|nr:hypothetical protein [Armatimonadota bacterium]